MRKELFQDIINELEDYIKNIVEKLLEEYQAKQKQTDQWLTIKETCKYIRVTEPTLWAMSKDGQLTKHYIKGIPRYKKSEIDNAFIPLNHKKPTVYA